ncbi:PspC domain-containing protein [Novosphingobium sp. SL115]|uniref:PspC domain-containing protein n=1 Tax=Novosphingobium sp. SL115 TaxID=2995150 RepID=UPI002277065F|nr:PspC domain-containing protein [Novosphingobium sp. SL115]MCY1672169.1 PspC domain-containing protein [Novosphingobium sp. SL115]
MTQLRFDDSAPRPIETSRGFRLDKTHGKFMGVCAGIANYFNVDVTMVRVAFGLATVLGFGTALIVYLLIGLIAD